MNLDIQSLIEGEGMGEMPMLDFGISMVIKSISGMLYLLWGSLSM